VKDWQRLDQAVISAVSSAQMLNASGRDDTRILRQVAQALSVKRSRKLLGVASLNALGANEGEALRNPSGPAVKIYWPLIEARYTSEIVILCQTDQKVA
jgi:hypothetical protein